MRLDFSGHSRKSILELQHQTGLGPELRAVWGIGYEMKSARSPALFFQRDAISVHEERVFGNLEWRPHAAWIINAGGFLTRNSWTGSHFTPRLMANFTVVPNHVLRAGVTDAIRTPNIFEHDADVRYFPQNLYKLPASTYKYAAYAFYGLPVRTYAASGNVREEKLQAQELGYFGNFRELRLTLDVRGFVERMQDHIEKVDGIVPGYVNPLTRQPIVVADFANTTGLRIRGVEYQLRWKPLEGTEIWLNQSFQKLIWDKDENDRQDVLPPARNSTAAWFQKLPYGLDFSLMLHFIGSMTWGGPKDQLPPRHRFDARLAWPFAIGSTKAEAALTLQAMNGDYPDYLLRKGFEFERSAFGTLRFAF